MLARDIIPDVCEMLGVTPGRLSTSEYATLEYIIENEWRFFFRKDGDACELEFVVFDRKSEQHNAMHEWILAMKLNGIEDMRIHQLFCAQINVMPDTEKIDTAKLLYSVYKALLRFAKDSDAIVQLNDLIRQYSPK